jgi:hypothetical protein
MRCDVPDEIKTEGKVLPLCLQEIEHCRPYFIGLLGERDGPVSEEIPESLFETQLWLRENHHQSVTAQYISLGTKTDEHLDETVIALPSWISENGKDCNSSNA